MFISHSVVVLLPLAIPCSSDVTDFSEVDSTPLGMILIHCVWRIKSMHWRIMLKTPFITMPTIPGNAIMLLSSIYYVHIHIMLNGN